MPTIHVLVRNGSRLAHKVAIVGEAGYAAHAHATIDALFAALERRAGPVCVVADVEDPLDEGLAILSGVQEFGIAIPVILMDGDTSISTVARVFKAGAIDYLVRPVPAQTLIEAVEEAADLALAIQESDALPAAMPARLASLTPKEREVMDLLIEGRSSKEISRELGISHRTVEIHRGRVMVKMHARNAAHLVRVMMGGGGRPVGGFADTDTRGLEARGKGGGDGEEAVD
ncbi:MAG: LuxR C-terminal-related transcriptional regulator [Azospirillaceae bacterium]